MAIPTAAEVIEKLSLIEHFEGGYFVESYRSGDSISIDSLQRPSGVSPFTYSSDSCTRSVCTNVFFLLKGTQVSHLHKIQSDETWHYYFGSATVRVVSVHPTTGVVSSVILGQDILNGQMVQYTVPAGHWFGAFLEPLSTCPSSNVERDGMGAVQVSEESYALVGCTVAPGFDVQDFTLVNKDELLTLIRSNSETNLPQSESWIKKLC